MPTVRIDQVQTHPMHSLSSTLSLPLFSQATHGKRILSAGIGNSCPSRDTHENPNDRGEDRLYQRDKRLGFKSKKWPCQVQATRPPTPTHDELHAVLPEAKLGINPRSHRFQALHFREPHPSPHLAAGTAAMAACGKATTPRCCSGTRTLGRCWVESGQRLFNQTAAGF
jgi:hypothetical protein